MASKIPSSVNIQFASLGKVKTAKSGPKDTVFGYIRRYEVDQSNTVPVLVKYLCLNHYMLTEKFADHTISTTYTSESLQTSTANAVDICMDGLAVCSKGIADKVFGSVVIEQGDEGISTFRWSFKVTDIDTQFPCIFIGLMDNDALCCGRSFEFDTNLYVEMEYNVATEVLLYCASDPEDENYLRREHVGVDWSGYYAMNYRMCVIPNCGGVGGKQSIELVDFSVEY